jgi:hypothetical protein
MTQPKTMIEGTSVRLSGRDLMIPPLTLGQVKRLTPLIEKIAVQGENLGGPEALDACVEVIHAAIKRNYPDMTKDEVEDLVDLRNVHEAISAVMGQSGLTPSGEARGEATSP